jgi:hypothetical protein
MKFTLVCEHDDGAKVTYEFNNIMLSDTLDNMQNFLKGCGFVFDGVLDIVDENGEQQPHDIIIETPDSQQSYKSYKFESDVDLDGKC